ncbi:MAG: DUF1998 domain-containing protein [Bacteroidetes bacterium]|nr:DUF1998 domain-containing protein [Bacteroidota bacterium]
MDKLGLYKSAAQKCLGPKYVKGINCSELSNKRRSRLIPSRFISVCGDGHIEDFPFIEWVHGGKDIEGHKLRLRAGLGSNSLSGVVIECSTCDEKKSMAGAFNRNSLQKVKSCGGKKPWLGEDEDNNNICDKSLIVVQRGATNVYFPHLRSSIYLPQWGKSSKRRIIQILDQNWKALTQSTDGGNLNQAVFEAFASQFQVNSQELLDAANQRFENEKNTSANPDITDSEESYRRAEYKAIITGEGSENQDFYVTNVKSIEYGESVSKFFSSISLIHKLRETRALIGFSRLLPFVNKTAFEMRSNLSRGRGIDWLPAIIVKGEGIFFEFDNTIIEEWSGLAPIQNRFDLLLNNYTSLNKSINQRFILIHTFAHILINQISYYCGYGSSSIRERIYCDCDPETPKERMNGVLIYTASGDSEGSLGGLVELGKPGSLEYILESAIKKSQWCSADPLCIDSSGQGLDNCNLAACHNCALLPETSCEEGNRLLDRGILIGTLDNDKMGYFSGD